VSSRHQGRALSSCSHTHVCRRRAATKTLSLVRECIHTPRQAKGIDLAAKNPAVSPPLWTWQAAAPAQACRGRGRPHARASTTRGAQSFTLVARYTATAKTSRCTSAQSVQAAACRTDMISQPLASFAMSRPNPGRKENPSQA
jgi:hypothetical protein